MIVLTIYFLAGLPSIKLFFYRLIPHSRRPRVILITDQITIKVGGYVLGNVLTSAIAGLGTSIWMLIFRHPLPGTAGPAGGHPGPDPGRRVHRRRIHRHPGRTDRLPARRDATRWPSTSVYRLAEDYLIVPRVMGRTVELPAVVSLVAVLLGGVLLGIVGALVAIPVAAALRVILNEVTFPRMDKG